MRGARNKHRFGTMAAILISGFLLGSSTGGPSAFAAASDAVYTASSSTLSTNSTNKDTQYPKANVLLNGNPISFDVPPVIINDRVMVPFRGLFEALAAHVWWDATAQTAYAAYQGQQLALPLGGYVIYKDKQTYQMDTPIMSLQDRVMIPMSFVVQALGLAVSWDESSKTANITMGNSSVSAARNIVQQTNDSEVQTITTQDQLVTVAAADPAVTSAQIQHVVDLLEKGSLLQNDAQDLGVSPHAGIQIQLASTRTGYQKLLVTNGFSLASAKHTSVESDGLAADETIYIPLEGQSDRDLTRTLAHELVHVLLNQSLGSNVFQVPIWLNEGVAWSEGIKQAYASDGAAGASYQMMILKGIQQDAVSGKLPSLVQDDTSRSNYEDHGYAAVGWLLGKKGLPALQQYFQAVKKGSPTAFADAFGMDIETLSKTVNQALETIRSGSDSGVDVKFTVDSTFQGTLAICSLKTNKTYYVQDPAQGSYTIHIAPDGTVSGMSGLSSANLPLTFSDLGDFTQFHVLFADTKLGNQTSQDEITAQLAEDLSSTTNPLYEIVRQQGFYIPLGVTELSDSHFHVENQTFNGITVDSVSSPTPTWP